MKIFFKLTAQSVKLNSPYMDSICAYNVDQFYEQAISEGVPFFKWGGWIEDQLNRLILVGLYK